MPDCLYAALINADFVFLSGWRAVDTSTLRPLAIWFSTSTRLRRTLEVVQAWVRVKPYLRLVYLASSSPEMTSDLLSRLPETLKATSEGVFVLTSRKAPVKG